MCPIGIDSRNTAAHADRAGRAFALELEPHGELHRARVGDTAVPLAEVRARQVSVERCEAVVGRAGRAEHVPVPQVEDLEADLDVRVAAILVFLMNERSWLWYPNPRTLSSIRLPLPK